MEPENWFDELGFWFAIIISLAAVYLHSTDIII